MGSAVIIGAGHNGLVAAAYLARAGLDVTVLEARETIGGASSTEEVLPGHRASACAFVVGLLRPQIIRDLELKRHGLELYQAPGVLGCTVTEDGAFFTYADLDRELSELRRHFGRRDAEGFLAFGAAMQRVGAILEPALLRAPTSEATMRRAFAAAGAPELFDPFLTGCSRDLLDAYFASPVLKGYLAFPSIVSVYGGPSTPGTAYVLTHHSVNEFEGRFGQWGFARGGLGAVSAALASAATAHGARIRVASPVHRILAESGRVQGVVLQDGEEIRADTVLSNADPVRTLLGLVGRDLLPTELGDALDDYDLRGSMARLHIAVDALPRYRGLGDGPGPQHVGHTLIGPSLERYEHAARAQAAGRLPSDFTVEVLIDSVREPERSPAGTHLVSVGVQQLPRQLDGRSWDDAKEEFTTRVLAQIDRFAPGFLETVTAVNTLTPLDLEREYGLTGGNIYHGAMGIDQLFGRRPTAALAHYRTPIEGLYLCGSGTHPGGGVMGAPGHNAAAAVLGTLERGEDAVTTAAARRSMADRVGAAVGGSPALRRVAASAGSSRLLRPLARHITTRRDRA